MSYSSQILILLRYFEIHIGKEFFIRILFLRYFWPKFGMFRIPDLKSIQKACLKDSWSAIFFQSFFIWLFNLFSRIWLRYIQIISKKIDLKIIEQLYSSSCYKRNWSTYSLILSRETKMDPKWTEHLVYEHYSQFLPGKD